MSKSASSPREDEIGGLYSVAPEEFVATRNELAKRLRDEGDSRAAAEVRKLKKPSVSAWALNAAATEKPDLAARLIEAGERLVTAQREAVEEGDVGELREATNAQHEAIEAILEQAREALRSQDRDRDPFLSRARDTLRAVATDEALRREFEAARITTDHEPIGFGSAAAAARPGKAKKGEPSPAKRREAQSKVRSAERALESSAKSVRRERERVERAEEALAEAREKLEGAERDHAEKERGLDAVRSDLE
jgi:hypothetical protein